MVDMAFGTLKVRFYGDPCLETKSKAVKEVGPVERMLIAAMFETMIAYRGVGLAAPLGAPALPPLTMSCWSIARTSLGVR